MKIPSPLLVFVTLAVCGCAVAPAEQELAATGYGRPLTIDYKKAIRDYMDTKLVDSLSARYKFAEPYQSWVRDAPITGSQLHVGYEVDVLLNAKNQLGGYTGFQPYNFLFRDNQIVDVLTPDTGGLVTAKHQYSE